MDQTFPSPAVVDDVERAEDVVPKLDTVSWPAAPQTARQRILDFVKRAESPQSIQAIMAGAGLSRNLADSTLSRAVQRGLLVRPGPGLYELAPVPEMPSLPAEKVRADGLTTQQWLDLLHAWHRGEPWQGPGNSPDREAGITGGGCYVPLDCWAQFQGQLIGALKVDEELARRKAADAALRDRLLSATNGNYDRSKNFDDMRVIHRMLASKSVEISVDLIETVVMDRYDRRVSPKNPPLLSWSDLMEHVAEHAGRYCFARKLLAGWQDRMGDPHATTGKSPTLRDALAKSVADRRARAQQLPPW